MIPIRDNIPSRRSPVVTVGIIAFNLLVFLTEVSRSEAELEGMIFRFGLIPREVLLVLQGAEPETVERAITRQVLTPRGIEEISEVREYRLDATWVGAFLPLLTSMFLHGGWMHLIGNMWFLWIFGDNVEDRLGRARYVLLYLVSGLVASATQVGFKWGDTVPMIGASGAVSGVLGAYFITYPHARLLTLLPFFHFFWSVVELPALPFLGFWFLFQVFQGTAALAGVPGDSVAWWAHVGGFVAGLIGMKLLAPELPGQRGPTWNEISEGR